MLASSLLILFLSASLDLPALADHMMCICKTGGGHMVFTFMTNAQASKIPRIRSSYCRKYTGCPCTIAGNTNSILVIPSIFSLSLSLSLSYIHANLHFLMSEMNPRIASPNLDMMDLFYLCVCVCV